MNSEATSATSIAEETAESNRKIAHFVSWIGYAALMVMVFWGTFEAFASPLGFMKPMAAILWLLVWIGFKLERIVQKVNPRADLS